MTSKVQQTCGGKKEDWPLAQMALLLFSAGQVYRVQAEKRPTIDSLVEQQEELCNSTVHLLPVQVEQGDHLEVHLSQQVGQLMDVSNGSTQLSVMYVVHVADQESDFVRCCVRKVKAS